MRLPIFRSLVTVWIVIWIALLYLVAADLALAQSPPSQPSIPVSRLDRNGDGRISPQELADLDGNGEVQPADVATFTNNWSWVLTHTPVPPPPPPPPPPQPTGACCVGTSCQTVTAAACAAAGGTYKGDGIACTATLCAASPPPPPPPSSYWREFPLPAGARRIYASASLGSDSNPGTEAEPVKSLSRAMSMIRSGTGDQLLLKKGDTWNAALTGVDGISQTGKSADEPIVFGSYGTGARPIVRSGGQIFARYHSGQSRGNIAVVGIHFLAATRNSGDGVLWTGGPDYIAGGGENIWFEDCRFTGLFRGIVMEGGRNLTIRRCVFEDICSARGQGYSPQPFYVNKVDGVLIEECYFLQRAFTTVRAPYNQDAMGYVNDLCKGAVVYRRNVTINKGNQGPDGLVGRSPMTVEDNVFDGLHTAMTLCGQDTPPGGGGDTPIYPNGTRVTVRGNVILRGVDMYTSDQGGWRGIGIQIGFTDPGGTGSLIENNIIANKGVSHSGAQWLPGINFDQSYYEGFARNVTVRNNVLYNWNGLVVQPPRSQQASGLKFIDNQIIHVGPTGGEDACVDLYAAGIATFSGNRYSSARAAGSWFKIGSSTKTNAQWAATEPTASMGAVTFPNPGAGLAQYAASVGRPATTDGAIDACLGQSRDTWDPRWEAAPILAYFRGNFGR